MKMPPQTSVQTATGLALVDQYVFFYQFNKQGHHWLLSLCQLLYCHASLEGDSLQG